MAASPEGDMRPDTLAVHAGRADLTALGVHVPPIDLSTTNPVSDVLAGGASYDNLATGGRPAPGDTHIYQRLWNPTVARAEEAVAALEGCDEAVLYASGMAALSAVLVACASAGTPHVVAVRPLYGGTDHVLDHGLLGTTVSWVSADGIADAITPQTGVVIVETPANPTLELLDLDDVVRQAGDVPVLVDNTFATPVLQQPARHGVTLVLHSATKYLAGHGDVIAGVVATNADWARRLRSVRALTGALVHPLSAYLIHRGLQTLPIRVRAQQATAQQVAEHLAQHPAVERVYYPGLPGQDPQGIIGRQLAGPGAMVAFAVKGGYDAAARAVDRTSLVIHAVSLGGVDSLIQHPASLTHRPVADAAKPHADVLRLSIGLEDAADLIADLDAALGD
ncbi:trans-sulfuration enzyme family protein [Arsenicicoccus dermatophilus]|uniref:trans-sulfuration enzyme family protein n=1 Tax=Arsenicicoccus dermatophilus TaxID=1076331 RepID=UPI001F4C9CA1|nr:aminotransferase class I/II-fold pyridoxal phosphate-dependent enzyme [Arsenicicoccus dermatophilus]MCH8613937.1 aminotransferase class I/II-fold pyridoxal phosphate-dependent enzyme [Arsenicicoccus dermatophilus]